MLCPFCQRELTKIEEKANSGSPLLVDFCFFCGGVWLDHFEANQISLKSVKELSKKSLSREKILTNHYSLLCPKCREKLEVARGESIPLNCTVYRCPSCGGNFFKRGELLKFKRAQKAKLNYFKVWQIPLHSAFAILLPLLFLTIISLSIPVTVYLVKQNQEQRTQAQELVKNINVYQVDKSSVLIVWETEKPVISEIEFGKTRFLGEKMTVSASPTTLHQVKIKNLLSGKRYYYRIIVLDNKKRIFFPQTSFLKD